MNIKYSLLLLSLLLITSCKSPEIALSGEKKLHSFTLECNAIKYNGEINEVNKSVIVKLPWNSYLAGLKSKAEVTAKAAYHITDSTNFSQQQTLTVIAEDKSSVDYKVVAGNSQRLNLIDPKIEILGCLHVKRDTNQISMSRFNDTNLAEPRINYMLNGQTQSGVIIRFRTNSTFVKVKFAETAGARWGIDYGVWADGIWFNNYMNHSFTFQKPAGKNFVTWEISPSLMNAVNLTSIEIENGKELTTTQMPVQPQYFAIGNSITQGVGQVNAGYLSYPFLFGRNMGYETYNLAVGGSKVSWKVATELENRKADLITVLWGYNDWYFVGETASSYKNMMLGLLNKIREYQPNSPLVCISLIGTENPTPSSAVKIEEYRAVVAQLVEERKAAGDANIYLLDGSTNNVELMDKVHPSVKGAADLAVILENFIKNIIIK
jgi:lysophospholipase L1-like esterase